MAVHQIAPRGVPALSPIPRKQLLVFGKPDSPFSGCVASYTINQHMQVQTGQVLSKLVNVPSVLVDVKVLESEIAKIIVCGNAELPVNAFR